VGYLVARPEVAAAVRKVITPFSTSSVAQAAALAACAPTRECGAGGDRGGTTGQDADRAAQLGADVPETQANFVWLPLGEDSVAFAAACEAAGIIVRPFPGDGVRVIVGTPAENDAFLAVAEVSLAG